MDDVLQEVDQALDIGFRNLKILELAAAWCQNIGASKGPLGTGPLEEATRLPITGGSLRCDYARAPTIYGMALELTAVDFYEQNCIGCPHRKPTAATEHLGTWADALLAERAEQRRREDDERRQAREARRRRHEERRRLLGAPEPTLQSILDLIDRIDSEAGDREAERLLVRHAEMSPGDFPDALVDRLKDDSLALRNDALLETVIAVFEREGRPATDSMLRAAFAAIAHGVATAAAARIIAVHAKRFDGDDRSLIGLVDLAAGREGGIRDRDRVGAEPAPLIHLYDLDSERAVRLIGLGLVDENIRQRATAAHAADKLVGARPGAGLRLLPALLEATRFADRSFYLGDPFASVKAQQVVANLLVSDPTGVAREIDDRMKVADAEYARQLWGCYDRAARNRRDKPLDNDLAEAIVTRAMALLRQELDLALLREVSETLDLVSRYHSEGLAIDLSEVVGLVLLCAERAETCHREPVIDAAALPEQRMHAFTEWEGQRGRSNAVLNNVEGLLKACACRDVGKYVDLLERSAWSRSAHSKIGRASLLRVLGSVVREQAFFDRAWPFLFAALGSDRPEERAAAYRALAEIGHHEVVLPEELTGLVLAALTNDDEMMSVFLAAIRTLGRIKVPAERIRDVINELLRFAQIYGPQRIWYDDVERALWRVLQLSQAQPYEDAVKALVLKVIGRFPSEEAAKLLSGLSLEEHADWPGAAARALGADPDSGFYGLADDKRRRLLRRLVDLPTHELAPQFEALERVGVERLPHDRVWTWAIADVLAYHQQHERAAALCDAVVAALPDTREQRPARRFARQIALAHHLDDAAAKGDAGAIEGLLKEVDELVVEAEE